MKVLYQHVDEVLSRDTKFLVHNYRCFDAYKQHSLPSKYKSVRIVILQLDISDATVKITARFLDYIRV